jgi:hypothetical protein
VSRMVGAFETRAQQLYGSGQPSAASPVVAQAG